MNHVYLYALNNKRRVVQKKKRIYSQDGLNEPMRYYSPSEYTDVYLLDTN